MVWEVRTRTPRAGWLGDRRGRHTDCAGRAVGPRPHPRLRQPQLQPAGDARAGSHLQGTALLRPLLLRPQRCSIDMNPRHFRMHAWPLLSTGVHPPSGSGLLSAACGRGQHELGPYLQDGPRRGLLLCRVCLKELVEHLQVPERPINCFYHSLTQKCVPSHLKIQHTRGQIFRMQSGLGDDGACTREAEQQLTT